MSKVIFQTSMSLDGFMTAAGQTPEEPLGDRGMRLHEWGYGSDEAGNGVYTFVTDGIEEALRRAREAAGDA
jgi:hypothetical protein